MSEQTPFVPPTGFATVVGTLRDGLGNLLTGSLIVEVPFPIRTAEPGIIPAGSYTLFVVAGQVCKDQAATTPGALPITPAGAYLKLRFKPSDFSGTERHFGRITVPDAATVDLPSRITAL